MSNWYYGTERDLVYIQHHGVLGMRWGHRKDRSSGGRTARAIKAVKSAPKNLVSRHRSNLESRYMNQGYSKKQAQEKADKRIKNEKRAAIIAAAAAGTAIAAYQINNKYFKDKVIRKGETLDTVFGGNPERSFDPDRRFYATRSAKDHKKYVGMYGKQLNGAGYYDLHNIQRNFNDDIKVASRHNARKVFNDLYKNDPEFRSRVDGIQPIRFTLDKYNRFNVSAPVTHDQNAEKAVNKYFEALRKKGYGAIEDINDMKYSGYETKEPLIVFGNTPSQLRSATRKVSQISQQEVESEYGPQLAKALLQNYGKKGATLAGVAGGVSAASTKAKIKKARRLRSSGASTKTIARQLGMSTKEVDKLLSRDK